MIVVGERAVVILRLAPELSSLPQRIRVLGVPGDLGSEEIDGLTHRNDLVAPDPAALPLIPRDNLNAIRIDPIDPEGLLTPARNLW